MEDSESKRTKQALKASRYYYENGYDQSKIAKEMGLSRPTVSRLLQFAKENGYVKINIVDPFSDVESLEKGIKDKFDLNKVIVTNAPSNDYRTITQNIGKAGAEYLESIVKDNDSIGVTWGRTVNEVANNLSPNSNPQENVKVVQIKGGVSHSATNSFAHEVISKFAKAFHTAADILPLPVIFDNVATSELVRQDKQTKHIMDEVRKTNIALFTVGTVRDDNMLFNLDYLTEDEINTLKANAVGDISSRFINAEGEIADKRINERTIGIELDELKEKDHSILIAGGEQKLKSIKAALIGKYANEFITDNFTAKSLMNL